MVLSTQTLEILVSVRPPAGNCVVCRDTPRRSDSKFCSHQCGERFLRNCFFCRAAERQTRKFCSDACKSASAALKDTPRYLLPSCDEFLATGHCPFERDCWFRHPVTKLNLGLIAITLPAVYAGRFEAYLLQAGLRLEAIDRRESASKSVKSSMVTAWVDGGDPETLLTDPLLGGGRVVSRLYKIDARFSTQHEAEQMLLAALPQQASVRVFASPLQLEETWAGLLAALGFAPSRKEFDWVVNVFDTEDGICVGCWRPSPASRMALVDGGEAKAVCRAEHKLEAAFDLWTAKGGPGNLTAIVCDMNAAPRICIETVRPWFASVLTPGGVLVVTLKNFLAGSLSMEDEVEACRRMMDDDPQLCNVQVHHLFANGRQERTLIAFRR